MKVFAKTSPGADKTVILAVREGLVQPFNAGQWLDLRVAFFLSVCGAADPASDDVITGLAESLTSPVSPITDQFFIGVRNNGTAFPGTGGVAYIGWTNINVVPLRVSKLVTSDAGTGTTNADYWRPVNDDGVGRGADFLIADGVQQLANVTNPVHFVQNFAGGHAAGYATLLQLQLTRPNAGETAPITVTIKSSATSGDVLFTNTTTAANLQSKMETLPTPLVSLGPVTLTAVPDSIFLYWPFHNSRLRIHCCGIEVIAP